uniref:Tetraspanin-8-like n=1 Tax=Ciona intestinalis TaxID=7719 RepID=F6V0K9_CIOIN|nr:tetraspanin-8-like [Ciona intestinalis]|eukprot:XP_002122534.1 tetraspanin-8-like [Ciona intestinalis]
MCCCSISHFIFYLLNTFIWFTGLSTLGIGIWLLVDSDIQQALTVSGLEDYTAGAIVFVVVGSIIFLVGFIGCCGVHNKKSSLKIMYIIFLGGIFAAEIGIGIWALENNTSLESKINSNMNVTGTLLNKTTDSNYKELEQSFECCGATQGCIDWELESKSFGCECNTTSENCVPVPANCLSNSTRIYLQPCSESIYNVLSQNLLVVGGVGIAFSAIEILAIVMTLFLLCCDNKVGSG